MNATQSHPLESLLAQHCPNGVEFKRLGEVCEVQKGQQLNKTQLLGNGKFPVINGSINLYGFWNEFNANANRITISQGGASAGYVNFMTTPFWAGTHCYIIENEKENVIYKFLYYLLKNQQNFLMTSQYGAGIPALAKNKIENLQIPLPPLEVQRDIVEILDKFDALTNDLARGLPTEIEARKKQYEYYRERLLDFR